MCKVRRIFFFFLLFRWASSSGLFSSYIDMDPLCCCRNSVPSCASLIQHDCGVLVTMVHKFIKSFTYYGLFLLNNIQINFQEVRFRISCVYLFFLFGCGILREKGIHHYNKSTPANRRNEKWKRAQNECFNKSYRHHIYGIKVRFRYSIRRRIPKRRRAKWDGQKENSHHWPF